MAFVYSELIERKRNIEDNKLKLDSTLSSFRELVESNVNNKRVWYGTSSNDFSTKFNAFADQNFATYQSTFTKEINNLSKVVEEWQKAETK